MAAHNLKDNLKSMRMETESTFFRTHKLSFDLLVQTCICPVDEQLVYVRTHWNKSKVHWRLISFNLSWIFNSNYWCFIIESPSSCLFFFLCPYYMEALSADYSHSINCLLCIFATEIVFHAANSPAARLRCCLEQFRSCVTPVQPPTWNSFLTKHSVWSQGGSAECSIFF